MSFGNKRLDDAFDNWVTQTPEDYFHYEEEEEEEEMPRKKKKSKK